MAQLFFTIWPVVISTFIDYANHFSHCSVNFGHEVTVLNAIQQTEAIQMRSDILSPPSLRSIHSVTHPNYHSENAWTSLLCFNSVDKACNDCCLVANLTHLSICRRFLTRQILTHNNLDFWPGLNLALNLENSRACNWREIWNQIDCAKLLSWA